MSNCPELFYAILNYQKFRIRNKNKVGIPGDPVAMSHTHKYLQVGSTLQLVACCIYAEAIPRADDKRRAVKEVNAVYRPSGKHSSHTKNEPRSCSVLDVN